MDETSRRQAEVSQPASGNVPDVTVLMPMRNAGKFLHAAIESVLQHAGASLELLIIDDGSTDGSREIVEAHPDARIRLIDGPRSGISACLNRGLRQARGSLIMRCDSDDLFPPGRIAAQVEFLARHPDYVGVCGPFSMVDSQLQPVAAPPMKAGTGDVASQILSGQLQTHFCTFAFRRSALESVGEFRPFFQTAEDIDFQLRLAAAGPIGYLPGNAYVYRLHQASITHSQVSVLRRFFETKARAMAAERAAAGTDPLMRGETIPLPQVDGRVDRADPASLHVAQMMVGEAWQRLAEGRRADARRTAWLAVKARPTYLDAWKSLVLICARSMR